MFAKLFFGWVCWLAMCLPAQAASAVLTPQPAQRLSHASQAGLLGSALAGTRLVAVGEHGVVLLSDDQGRHWRQAQTVPVRATLTAVSFANAKRGWAVGHWGVVLLTEDGGETWQLQRQDLGEDRPLFSVQALDEHTVVAAGLWSLLLRSVDGGRKWERVKLMPPPGAAAGKADLNLFHLFSDAQGLLFAAAERGMLLRSEDKGLSWSYLPTGYKGSFWAGLSPAPGVLLLAGLRGSLYRSSDAGRSWTWVESGSKSSITALLASRSGVLALGLDGLVLRSQDQGASFSGVPREDRAALTNGLVLAQGQEQLFSRQGPVAPLVAR